MGVLDRLSESIKRGSERSETEQELMAARESLRSANTMADYFAENLTRLELAQEEMGWRRMAATTKREFTRAGLADIIELSHAMYLNNPLINRAVNVTTFYTWAQGVLMKAADDKLQKEIIEPMLSNDWNKAEFYSHSARLLSDVEQLVEGNIWGVLFTDLEGNVELRSVPTEQIQQIHHAEGDQRKIYFYRRFYAESVFDVSTGQSRLVQKQVLHPDWRYQPRDRPDEIGGIKVEWDAPIIHLKSGGLKSMMFGVPETYAAMDWARAYKKFLENWHSMIASLSKFSWQVTTKGSKVKGTADKLKSTIPEDPEEIERNDRSAGGAFVGKPGDEITPIPKNAATTSADDSRPSRLMVASAMNMPDTILSGDVDIGNFATSKTLDRPTELYMKSRQMFWADFHTDIFRYSIEAKVRRGKLPGKVLWTPDGDNSTAQYAGDADIEVSYPPILEQDMGNVVRAVVAAMTLEGKEEAGAVPRDVGSKKLLEALGVEDVEDALKQLSPEEVGQLQEDVKDLQEAFKKFTA